MQEERSIIQPLPSVTAEHFTERSKTLNSKLEATNSRIQTLEYQLQQEYSVRAGILARIAENSDWLALLGQSTGAQAGETTEPQG
ncbi:MAG: hypothetical protein WCF57_09440 [Pyrinomonadaceae bacterium]